TTVNRLARGVIELSLRDADGNEETIRPTDEHLFYSASHGDWLPAGELQPGEHLDGVNGTITVASVTPLTGTHRVYNMTVQGEHLYRVAESGVLVHNQYPLFGTKGANTKIHHMVSYFKNSKRGFSSPWSQMSQDILKNAGLNPKHSRWNKIHLPNHKGPHPEIAHKLVYRRLQDATKHLTPHTIGYKEAVRVEMIKLANDILANPKAFGL
ncbi:MAG: AHH domain-containing protein, partial [Planctomycetes bacterium]|nr:AHH domain-containing protein [Planctomycetota bacterium]